MATLEKLVGLLSPEAWAQKRDASRGEDFRKKAIQMHVEAMKAQSLSSQIFGFSAVPFNPVNSLQPRTIKFEYLDEVDDSERGFAKVELTAKQYTPHTHAFGTAIDIKLNTEQLDKALNDLKETTQPQIAKIIDRMNSDHTKRLASMILNGAAIVTGSEMKNHHDDFPRFTIEGALADYSGNSFFDFDDEADSPKTKATKAPYQMKSPNENAVVHEIARDLVRNETLVEKANASLADAEVALIEADNNRQGVNKEARDLVRAAEIKAEEMMNEAKAKLTASREARDLAKEAASRVARDSEESRAALHVARASASEDIELVIGAHVVRSIKSPDGSIAVTCTKPAKVAKTAA